MKKTADEVKVSARGGAVQVVLVPGAVDALAGGDLRLNAAGLGLAEHAAAVVIGAKQQSGAADLR